MKKLFGLLIILFCMLPTDVQSQDISGYTTAIINLRRGPGTNYDILTILPEQTSITLIGRDESRHWLLLTTGQYRGWINYAYANVQGDIGTLPVSNEVINQQPAPETQTNENPNVSDVQEELAYEQITSTPPGIILRVTHTSLGIFQKGQLLGNRPNVFAKVGDSITSDQLFLYAIGYGRIDYGQYEYLRDTVAYFSQRRARTHNSFANNSVAAAMSWTTSDVLYAGNAPSRICRTEETPLECEYRLTRPSIALIMFGTNDINTVDHVIFEENLREIIDISIDMGVIPVVSTIPDHFLLESYPHAVGRRERFNNIIRLVTAHYDTPLWDYWQIMQWLPNNGINDDLIHPSSMSNLIEQSAIFTPEGLQYGYNMRNLTALMVLDTIRKEIIEVGN